MKGGRESDSIIWGGPSEGRKALGRKAPPRKHCPGASLQNTNQEDTAKHMPHGPSDQAKGAPLKKHAVCLPPTPSCLSPTPPRSFWLAAFLTNQQDTCALQKVDIPIPPSLPPTKPHVWYVPAGLISARNKTHSSPCLVPNSTRSSPQHGGWGAANLTTSLFPLAKQLA